MFLPIIDEEKRLFSRIWWRKKHSFVGFQLGWLSTERGAEWYPWREVGFRWIRSLNLRSPCCGANWNLRSISLLRRARRRSKANESPDGEPFFSHIRVQIDDRFLRLFLAGTQVDSKMPTMGAERPRKKFGSNSFRSVKFRTPRNPRRKALGLINRSLRTKSLSVYSQADQSERRHPPYLHRILYSSSNVKTITFHLLGKLNWLDGAEVHPTNERIGGNIPNDKTKSPFFLASSSSRKPSKATSPSSPNCIESLRNTHAGTSWMILSALSPDEWQMPEENDVLRVITIAPMENFHEWRRTSLLNKWQCIPAHPSLVWCDEDDHLETRRKQWKRELTRHGRSKSISLISTTNTFSSIKEEKDFRARRFLSLSLCYSLGMFAGSDQSTSDLLREKSVSQSSSNVEQFLVQTREKLGDIFQRLELHRRERDDRPLASNERLFLQWIEWWPMCRTNERTWPFLVNDVGFRRSRRRVRSDRSWSGWLWTRNERIQLISSRSVEEGRTVARRKERKSIALSVIANHRSK